MEYVAIYIACILIDAFVCGWGNGDHKMTHSLLWPITWSWIAGRAIGRRNNDD